MLRVLYHIVPPDEFTGNTRNALELLEFSDDEKVDWQEFNRFHVLFPALFYPAFRMQNTMITETMGQRWWDKKKRTLYEEKVRRDMIEQLALREEPRVEKVVSRPRTRRETITRPRISRKDLDEAER